ncbi:MAG: hypothetical protein ACRDIB_07790 [Ardenticatenaceae bacterium]
MGSYRKQVATIDSTVVDFMSEAALPLLRTSLGVTYIWFGALKIAGVSPVAGLVARTVPLLPERAAVVLMGIWEVTIGIGLLFRVALRLTLALFFLQVAGTFMTFLMQPREVFQHSNPLRLTKDGEFIVKNLVLLSAGLAVGSTAQRDDEEVAR